jgi:hypothetical protein
MCPARRIITSPTNGRQTRGPVTEKVKPHSPPNAVLRGRLARNVPPYPGLSSLWATETRTIATTSFICTSSAHTRENGRPSPSRERTPKGPPTPNAGAEPHFQLGFPAPKRRHEAKTLNDQTSLDSYNHNPMNELCATSPQHFETKDRLNPLLRPPPTYSSAPAHASNVKSKQRSHH